MAQQDWFAANAPKADGGDWFAQNAPSAPAQEFAAPAGTPSLKTGGNAKTPMHEVELFTGREHKPGGVAESVGNVLGGAAKSIADVSTPVIAHRMGQKAGVISPRTEMYPGEVQGGDPQFNAIMTQGALMAAGGAEGDAEAPTPRGRTVPKPPSGDLPPEQTEAIDKANRIYKEAKAQVAKRQGLQDASKSMVQKTFDNLHVTHDAARGALDQRWSAFRDSMEGAQLDPSAAFNNIEAAKAKYLKGSPASLKVFNDLAREMGIQEFMEGDGGALKAIPGSGELPFDTARIHYSAIGDKLAQGNLPGNVYQALKSVEEGLDRQLTAAADTRGLGKAYTDLKGNESQFRRDWTDSKSPLARAHKALSPAFLEQHVINPAKGEYISNQLKRYTEHGAQPHLPLAARRFASEAAEITKKVPEVKELPKGKAAATGKGTHKIARAGRRMALKLGGAKVGGFPGYLAGGEIDNAIEEGVKRRQRSQTVPSPPE